MCGMTERQDYWSERVKISETLGVRVGVRVGVFTPPSAVESTATPEPLAIMIRARKKRHRCV